MRKSKAKQTGGPAKKDKKDDKPTAEASTAAAAAAASEAAVVDDDDAVSADEPADASASTAPAQPPSLSEQSKARSTSFRKASGPLSPIGAPTFQPGAAGGPLSPDGETAPDIYRKHVARIDELERENRRLTKEAGDADKRWQKAEEELADLREADGGGDDAAEGGSGGGGGSGSGSGVARLVCFTPTFYAWRAASPR